MQIYIHLNSKYSLKRQNAKLFLKMTELGKKVHCKIPDFCLKTMKFISMSKLQKILQKIF